jgi:nitrogen regulatory protein PII
MEDVKNALTELGIGGMTVSEVKRLWFSEGASRNLSRE